MFCDSCKTDTGAGEHYRFITGSQVASQSIRDGNRVTTTTTYSGFAPLNVYFCEQCIAQGFVRRRWRQGLYVLLSVVANVVAIAIPLMFLFSVPVLIVNVLLLFKKYRVEDDVLAKDVFSNPIHDKAKETLGNDLIWTEKEYEALRAKNGTLGMIGR